MKSPFRGSHAEMLATVVLCAFCPRGILASTTSQVPNLKAPIDRAQLTPGKSYRNNFCDRQAQVENGEIEMPDALKGMNISVHLIDWKLGKTIKYDDDGILDDYNPGLFVNVLDGVAKRAGFQWRDSFGVGLTPSMDPYHPNASFTDVLEWGVDTYDISIGEWRNSLSRRGRGIYFPLGFVDASLIMVQKAEKAEFSPFLFLMVFEWKVWLLIIATYIFSALCYRFIHKYGKGEDVNNTGTKGINLFSSFMYFNQQHEFSPKSNAGRIFTFSMSFFSMLVISSYTANLVSFLVLREKKLFVPSYKEAEGGQHPVCVWKDTSAHNFLREHYPDSVFVELETKDEMYDSLNQGKCTIVSDTAWSWQEYERNKKFNKKCGIVQVGQRAEVSQLAGMGVQSNITTCTSLLSNVLDYHLSYLNEKKIFEEEQERYLNEIGKEQDCDTRREDQSETATLGLKHLAGLFITHGMLVTLAFVVVVWEKTAKDRKERMNHFGGLKQFPIQTRDLHHYSENIPDETMKSKDTDIELSPTLHYTPAPASMSHGDIVAVMDKFKSEFFEEFSSKLSTGQLRSSSPIRSSSPMTSSLRSSAARSFRSAVEAPSSRHSLSSKSISPDVVLNDNDS